MAKCKIKLEKADLQSSIRTTIDILGTTYLKIKELLAWMCKKSF